MDILSDILENIRLRGTVYFQSDFPVPWGMSMDRTPFAQFHAVVRGECWLQFNDESAPTPLSVGDMLLLPFGDAHALTHRPGAACIPGRQVLAAIERGELAFDGEQNGATLLCGHFEMNRELSHPLLESLPRLLHIKGSERYDMVWLESAARLISSETASGLPGAAIAVDRLADVLFIHLLRAYVLQKDPGRGFLAALKDERLRYALELMHERPGDDWTLETIARSIGVSRTSFATRFKKIVGLPPLDYLTGWRMQKAHQFLRETDLPAAEIAERVGYKSEAAFHRTFKRRYGVGPGVVRRRKAPAGAGG